MDYQAAPAVRAIAVRRCFGLIVALSMLTGCVANSSNPVVSIASASMSDSSADVTLHIVNPGGRDLTVTSISYELNHGEMGFPLASETWTGQLGLPAQGEADLPLSIPFDDEPIEDDSTLLQINGEMSMEDHTGFLGLSFMNLTATPFQANIEARRIDP